MKSRVEKKKFPKNRRKWNERIPLSRSRAIRLVFRFLWQEETCARVNDCWEPFELMKVKLWLNWTLNAYHNENHTSEQFENNSNCVNRLQTSKRWHLRKLTPIIIYHIRDCIAHLENYETLRGKLFCIFMIAICDVNGMSIRQNEKVWEVKAKFCAYFASDIIERWYEFVVISVGSGWFSRKR